MRVALLLALLLLLACCPTATPGKAKKKKVTSQASSSPAAARRCAVCAFLVEHLRDRAEEAAAAGTSYEMGWRLKPDGTRVEKRVPWAESELGFGAAVEEACKSGDGGPLAHQVQLALGEERGLRRGRSAEEAGQTLRGDALRLYASTCEAFVFDSEGSLDPIRAPGQDLATLREKVCTKGARVCPKSHWQRWADGEPALVPRPLPPPPEGEPRRAARSDKAKTPRWWEALHPAAGLCIGLGLGLLGARLLSGPAHGPEPGLSASDVRAARLKAVGEEPREKAEKC